MKRPNNLFQKKYISSLVIAAFLILSVLTAYNIKIGNADGGKSDNKTKTETTEKSNDVIGPVSGNDTGSATNSADSAANNDMDAVSYTHLRNFIRTSLEVQRNGWEIKK